MLESLDDLIKIALGLTVVWFLWGHRRQPGGHPGSEHPGDGAGEPSRR
jgi:hypothetical protein